MKIDSDTRRGALVTAVELDAMLRGPRPPVVLSVQSINPYTGADSRVGEWIPGALDAEAYVDFQAPSSAEAGARPLPDIAALQAAARRWGLTPERTVVVYDNDRSMTAARAWWVLKWAGLRDARVLDGGLSAWRRAGFGMANNSGQAIESDIVLSSGHMPEFGAVEALELGRTGILLDARIRPNYIGGPEIGGDPKRGHIPGAISAPTHDTLTDPGEFADSATLAAYFEGLGVTQGRPVGVYCGAGMSAAHTVLALAAVGVTAAMYPGSWSQWINDPTRPVRRGPRP